MGQRGNIVQNYPSVEYDFVPTNLTATTSTYIHRQVSGSNTTPAGAGNGRESTDRSNFVQLVSNDIGANYVAYAKNITQTGKVVDNDDQMDDAAAHQDLGLMRYSTVTTPISDGNRQGGINYMSTRNNDFSNRSHKGQIVVTSPNGGSDESKTDVAKIALIAGGSVAGVVVVGGGAAYVATHRDSFSFGGSGGAKAPAGYA